MRDHDLSHDPPWTASFPSPAVDDDAACTELALVAQAASVAQQQRDAAVPLVITPTRRRRSDGVLPRMVDAVPYLGPALVSIATTVWLYNLLVLARLAVTG